MIHSGFEVFSMVNFNCFIFRFRFRFRFQGNIITDISSIVFAISYVVSYSSTVFTAEELLLLLLLLLNRLLHKA